MKHEKRHIHMVMEFITVEVVVMVLVVIKEKMRYTLKACLLPSFFTFSGESVSPEIEASICPFPDH